MNPPLKRMLAIGATSALWVTGLAVFAPSAQADVTDVVINEFYGRGGSANQPYTNKFVELYNPSAQAADLTGTSIQYRSATGTSLANSFAALTGTIAPGGYYLVELNSNGAVGDPLPTPDVSATDVTPSGSGGTIFLAQATMTIDPTLDAELVIDKLGYGTSNSPETTAVSYPGSNSTPGSLNRTNFVDTDDNSVDFTFSQTVTPRNSGTGQPGGGDEPVTATIAEIQGTDEASPMVGQRVVTEGVVTAAYPTGGFNGMYIQTPGSGGAEKVAGEASDGVFVFSASAAAEFPVGACVSVAGTVEEYYSLTEVTAATVTAVADCDPVTATELDTMPASDAEKERYEGMLVQPSGSYTITNNYQLNQFGQVGLAIGEEPLYQATDVVVPSEAAGYEAGNVAKYITLDDGSSWNYLSNASAQLSPLPYLSAATPMRTGSQVSFSSPVILDYRFQWNFQPLGQVVGADDADNPVTTENDRETSVPEVGGNLKVAAFNVLNYFDDLGQDEEGCAYYADREGNPVITNNCQVRGAWTDEAFADQKSKIVSAINQLDADVVALMEIENSAGISYLPGQPRDKALADLVDGLNTAAGETRWAYVASPTVSPSSEDVIRTALIYQPDSVQTVGASEIGLDSAFANARYPLAQRFKATESADDFVVIANHFKSKGSGEDDGTGQGLSNPSREAQATQLTAWAEQLFADEAVFLVGDFNAYSRETPVQIIEAAGYTNTAKHFEPASASYQFSGRLGSLDHVFANQKAMAQVSGAAIWDINADESLAFQYSRRNYNVVDFHSPDPFASSDHDPVVVGIETEAATAPFIDVPLGTQFIDEIRWMKEQGISTGWDDGSYRPLQPVARDAMAAFLYRIAGSPSVAGQTEPFSDVTEADEHYDAIVWAYQTGVTTGWDDGTFRPLQPIDRNAMMAFVHRYAGAPEYDAPTHSPFADLQPSDPFYTEIMWAYDNGITTGWPDGTFRPFDPTNRGATAAFLYRMVEQNGIGEPS